MPKQAPYLLQWSKSAQAYELFEGHGSILIENISENAAWFAWLQNISSFAFHSRSGAHYTVRKEHIQKNGP